MNNSFFCNNIPIFTFLFRREVVTAKVDLTYDPAMVWWTVRQLRFRVEFLNIYGSKSPPPLEKKSSAYFP